MQFVWNPDKAAANLKKHGVGFEEAATVFGDFLARIFDDEVHSNEERRELIIGMSIARRILIVSFTERDSDTIRIISARETTPRERRKYEHETG